MIHGIHHDIFHDRPEPSGTGLPLQGRVRDRLQGIRATRLGRRSCADDVICEMSPRGFPIYWLGAAGKPADAAEDTDFWATQHGFVSVSPLQTDLTNHRQVAMAHDWVGGHL